MSTNNESLVRRGEVMFDTAFLGNWRAAELRAMNKGKEGPKYVYPSSLIWLLLLAIVHTYLLPYRQLEGFMKVMSRHIKKKKLKVPDYTTTTMHWRVVRVKVQQLDPEVDLEKGVIIAACCCCC